MSSRSSFSTSLGMTTNVPSANGARMAWACPPSFLLPQKPPCPQEVWIPLLQNSQVPSENAKGARTRSPFFRV
ncbi:hypothetical protein [Nostoc sp.]|uniref:hypothetical protein n=1 Tax=Nostoc sp. TaxID=1180 RepID=UPI002FF896C0